MVQGLAFLSKKNFNPHNNSNRKLVWEAQEKSRREKERIQRRELDLKKEQEDEDLERVRKGDIGGSQAQLRFMYDLPPGMDNNGSDEGYGTNNNSYINSNSNGNSDSNSNTKDVKNGDKQQQHQAGSSLAQLAQVKAGDDAATVEFRRMLSAVSKNPSADTDTSSSSLLMGSSTAAHHSTDSAQSFKFTPCLQGMMESRDKDDYDGKGGGPTVKADISIDNRSALEKEVGRKNRSSQNNLSYQQQIERFPQLKNAPMEAKPKDDGNNDATAPMMVNFKPLGVQILHVRCMSCGIWGHARGDRECAKSGWNPFALPASVSSSTATATVTVTTTKSQRQQQSSSFTSIGASVASVKKSTNSTNNDSSSYQRRRHRRHYSDCNSDSPEDRNNRRRRYDSGRPANELKLRKDRDFYDDSNSSDDNEGKGYREWGDQERSRSRKSSKKKRKSSNGRKKSSKKEKRRRRHDSP